MLSSPLERRDVMNARCDTDAIVPVYRTSGFAALCSDVAHRRAHRGLDGKARSMPAIEITSATRVNVLPVSIQPITAQSAPPSFSAEATTVRATPSASGVAAGPCFIRGGIRREITRHTAASPIAIGGRILASSSFRPQKPRGPTYVATTVKAITPRRSADQMISATRRVGAGAPLPPVRDVEGAITPTQ